jgi:hypothetical protein
MRLEIGDWCLRCLRRVGDKAAFGLTVNTNIMTSIVEMRKVDADNWIGTYGANDT